jgi:uncharacterized NAD(P)/FAD-binding protein YdhS
MRSRVRTIAIIGGGFSGTVLAANLLRRPPARLSRIVLIERREQIGRGVAYQATAHRPLLNVPAERMSADPQDPLQFARYARRRDPALGAQQFLPRELYGEYLQQLLRQAAQTAAAQVTFESVRGDATTLHRIDSHGPYLIGFSDRRQLLADEVVLACGDPQPVDSPWLSGIAGHPSYVCDPHCDAALRADGKRMLLIGTALTMADVAVAAVAHNPCIELHALSRHGLLPAVQSGAATHSADAVTDFRPYLADGPVGALHLLRAFRALLHDLQRRGGDWLDAVNAARLAAPALWQRMPAAERHRFLRHLRVYWDVHRHRMAPATGAQLAQLRQAGRLQIHAGHMLAIEDAGGSLRVRWRPRGTTALRELTFDRVIDCSGSARRLERTQDPLLRGLIATGLAVPDPLGLGWLTGAHGALIDGDGRTARHLHYLGPMLRADHWEATAVGELRLHAQRLAAELVRNDARAGAASATGYSTNHSMSCTSPRL